MPLYNYECSQCHFVCEDLQSIHDPPHTLCPSCQQETLQRVFGIPNVRVRGSAKTLGSLAEDNTYALIQEHGKEKAGEILHENVYGKGGNRLKLPKGAKLMEPPKENKIPWWRSGEIPGVPRLEKPLDLRTIKNKEKYVMTGEKD